MKPDKTIAAIYLAGFFDGRGCFNAFTDKKKFQQFKVKVMDNSEYNLNLIEYMINSLNVKTTRDNYNALWISNRQEVKRFTRLILPFIQIRKGEIEEFENKLYEYELSFIKEEKCQKK